MRYRFTVKGGRFEQIGSPSSFFLNKKITPKELPRNREKAIREKAGISIESAAIMTRVPIYHYLAWESGTGFIPAEEGNRIRNLICVLEANQSPSIKSKIDVTILAN